MPADDLDAIEPPSHPMSDRAVSIHTSGCGSANDGFGSGVMVGSHHILTAAHVVASSESIVLESPSALFDDRPGDVLAIDRAADLALIALPDGPESPSQEADWPSGETVRTGRAGLNDQVVIISGTADIAASIVERSLLRTDEVRGTEPVERVAYRLDVDTAPGDSGAGVYTVSDGLSDGTLVGIIFANSTEIDNSSWAVAGSEIEAFLDAIRLDEPTKYHCDQSTSRLVDIEQTVDDS